jgi:GTP cyclohydrolase I
MNHSQGPSASELAERPLSAPNEISNDVSSHARSHSLSPHRLSDKATAQRLPDVANEHRPEVSGHLDRVGMSGIELIARFQGPDQTPFLVPATADAFVSLDDDSVKGIHMSRLFLELASAMECESLTPKLMQRVCENFLASHAGISHRSQLTLAFQHPTFRPALLSDYSAPRHYPVRVTMVSDTRDIAKVATGAHVRLFLQVQVVYSSTCPCSAALSRQLLEKKFQQDFAFHNWVNVSRVSQWLTEHGSIATPHSQRSVATIDVELANPLELKRFPIERIIDRIESTLKTAVQTVVKRQDEQEFARLNGANQMFCEDAARRMKATLLDMPEIADFRVEARHMESLHPHDAVAIATAGIPGGMSA